MKKEASPNRISSKAWRCARGPVFRAAALIIVFIFAAAVVDAIRCASGFITVRYEVASPKISAAMRFVMLTDLHAEEYGESNCELLDAVRAEEPDLIFVNGDMISAESSEEEVEIALSLITALTDIAPVYLSYGNHEEGYLSFNGPEILERYYETGAIVLDAAYKDMEVNGQFIRIGGTSDYCFNHYQLEKNYRLGRSYQFMSRFCNTDLFKLLLCHIPQNYYPHASDLRYEDWNCDLVLSGHTHGGLWRIPFIGAPYLPGQGFFPKLVHGEYDIGNAEMIIGAGLIRRDRVPRLNDPCELVVITLVPGE